MTERSNTGKNLGLDTIGMMKKVFSKKLDSKQHSSQYDNKVFDFNINMITGTQLRLNKQSVSFFTSVGTVSTCEIEVTNIGTTAVYYEWQKCKNKIFHEHSLNDTKQRFFCHHVIVKCLF